MARKKRRITDWQNAGFIVTCVLLGSLVIRGWYTSVYCCNSTITDIVIMSVVSLLIGILIVVLFRAGTSPLKLWDFGRALLVLALLVGAGGLQILILGVVGGRVRMWQVDRIESVKYFYVAGVLAITGFLLLYAIRRSDEKSKRDS